MIRSAIPTKWKFVAEFEDDETREIFGTIGEADTHEECEGSVEDEVQYYRSCGQTVLNAEAWEVCAQCEGEGLIQSGNDGHVICQGCGGHLGSISPVVHLRIKQLAGAKGSSADGASFPTHEKLRQAARSLSPAFRFEDPIASLRA